jgi:superfamily II DNA or RNA helicase
MDDLLYLPWSAGLDWIEETDLEKLLVVGSAQESDIARLVGRANDTRELVRGSEPDLASGVYARLYRGQWFAVARADGGPEGTPQSFRSRRATPAMTGHIDRSMAALDDLWDNATPMQPASAIQVGDTVRVTSSGEVGAVSKVTRMRSGYQITVAVSGRARKFRLGDLEQIKGDPSDPAFWIQQGSASADDVALTMTYTKLRNPLTDVLYSFAASKTIFRAYQFIPAIRMLTGGTGRLLVADEVGLGKTIEAGLIWNELDQRFGLDQSTGGNLRRALVIAPASLAYKWRDEMDRRFDRPLEIIKPDRLRKIAADVASGGDPSINAVISVESLRAQDEVLELLSDVHVRFDFVVIDEAHQMRNRGRKTNDMGRIFSLLADNLLLLSATPVNLRTTDLFNLLNLLDEGTFPDETTFDALVEPNAVLNRALRSVLGVEPGRKALRELDRLGPAQGPASVGASLRERPIFRRLEELLDTDAPLGPSARAEAREILMDLNPLGSAFTRTRKVDLREDRAVREAQQVHVTWSAAESELYDLVWEFFMARAREMNIPPGFAMQMPLRQAASCLPALQRRARNAAAQQADYDDDPDEVELEGAERTRAWAELAAEYPKVLTPIVGDTKYDAFAEKLQQLRAGGIGQYMVFSTFPGTLEYLRDRLSDDGFDARVMTGKTPMDQRADLMDRFREGEFEVFLLSEVGSEGLDFQTCNVVVNYDLPWNPMRVEQRIGRVDRFGQEHEKIFVINMHIPGTIESDIFERLYSRIDIFRDSVGDLEPILESEFSRFQREVLNPTLNKQQRQQLVDAQATALENEKKTLQRLEDSRAYLPTLDNLRVAGMSENGPDGGRFVGPVELERLIRRLIEPLGGTLKPAKGEHVWQLRGTPEIAARVGDIARAVRTDRNRYNRLEVGLRNGAALLVTFDAPTASKHNVDLISVRHPLVEAALLAIEDDRMGLNRYGVVHVPGLPPGSRYAVQLDLAESTGIRPRLEMWATALDCQTLKPALEVEDLLLSALASGTLIDGRVPHDIDMADFLEHLDDEAWERQGLTKDKRAADNSALVDARLSAKQRSYSAQRKRWTEDLLGGTGRSRDERMIRMAKGAIRNIDTQWEREGRAIRSKTELTLDLSTVAYLLLVGEEA